MTWKCPFFPRPVVLVFLETYSGLFPPVESSEFQLPFPEVSSLSLGYKEGGKMFRKQSVSREDPAVGKTQPARCEASLRSALL